MARENAILADALEWAKAEVDQLLHTGFTCDTQGTIVSARADGRERALRALLERYGDGYEHDPDTCEPCAKADKIMEDLHDDND